MVQHGKTYIHSLHDETCINPILLSISGLWSCALIQEYRFHRAIDKIY